MSGTTEQGGRGAPGWYPDPEQPATVRYWDGSGWTEQRAPSTAPTVRQPGGDITTRTVLGLIGAIAAGVAVFLPMVDSETSLHIADNSIFAQSQTAGGLALLLALAAGVAALESRRDSGFVATLIIPGALLIAGAAYAGTGKRRELVTTGPFVGGHHFQGSPGVGIYVLGVGGALIMLAGFIAGNGASADAAPEALAPAAEPRRNEKGHHPLDPDGYKDGDREPGWYVDPDSPWTMKYWGENGWASETRKTPKETLDGWWKVKQ